MISIMTEWMVWNLALGGGLLTASCLFAAMIKSPVRRLRWLEWTLLAALLAPILATTTFPWKHSLHWLPAKNSTATVPAHLDSVASESLVPKQNSTPVIHTTDGPVPYVSLSAETVSQNAPQVQVTESNVSNNNRETNWPVVMLSVHAVVMGMTFLWWGIGWGALRRLWRQGKALKWDQLEVDCGPLQGKVELRSHARVNTPCAFGWWHWKILIPEEMAKASHRKQLRMASAHEWAHLSRGDLRTWRWTRFAQLALWMQPAYWWMRSQVRLCQDYLADSEAAASGGHTDFAAFLLSVARTQQSVPGSVLSLKGKNSDLTRRIRMLIESKGVMETRCPGLLQGLAALLTCCVLGGAAWIQLEAQDGKDTESDIETNRSTETNMVLITNKCRVYDMSTDLPIEGVSISIRQVNKKENEYSVFTSEYVTDALGRYEFTIQKALLENPDVRIRLNISHPDYVDKMGLTYWTPPDVKTGKKTIISENLPLHPSRKVTGQLLDPRGNPAPNVQIKGISFIQETPTVFPSGMVGHPLEERTDDEGNFTVKVLKLGIANLSFFSEDFPVLQVGVAEETENLGQIKLQTGFKQKVLLLDADGKPAEGVSLSCHLRGQTSEELDGVPTFVSPTVISDDSGYVTIPLLNEGTYDFTIDSGPEFLRDRPKTYTGIFLNQFASVYDDHGTIVIKAQPTVMIQVKQVDTEGNPVVGHSFSVLGRYGAPENYRQRYSVPVTGNVLGFNIVEVPQGMYGDLQMFFPSKRAYDITHSDNGVTYKRGGADLGYITNDITDIVVVHRDLPVVLVQVVGETGENFSDAKVTALDHRYPYPEIEFDRDSNGRWRSPGMQMYTHTQIAASKEGYYDATQYVSDLVAEEVREITLVMKKK